MGQAMWTVLYSHGRDGDPWFGEKIQAMRPVVLAAGMNLVSVKYDESESIQQMIERTVERCSSPEFVPDKLVLLGSSRGAYISAATSEELHKRHGKETNGLFMISPAIGIKPDYYPVPFPEPKASVIEVIHAYRDNIIPFQNAVDFCSKRGATLHLVNDDHRINVEKDFVVAQLERFLSEIVKK